MHRSNTIVAGGVAFPQRKIVRRGAFPGTACLAAVIGSVAFTNFSFAKDGEDPGASAPAATATAQRVPASEKGAPAQSDRSGDEGHVRHHGSLGVLLSKSDDGVVVVGLMPGSPAEQAGLRVGDEIRFVGDDRIQTIPELTQTVGGYKPGTPVELLIRRNGKRQVVEVTLADREAATGRAPTPRGDQPAARGRVPAASPAPGPTSSQARERQMSQRMRALERQLYLLQRELHDLKYSQSVHAADAYDANSWWERQHRGEADDDPALFQ